LHDNLVINYSGIATGFSWEFDAASAAGQAFSSGLSAAGLQASALANVPTKTPTLNLASVNLAPGSYTLKVQALNGGQASGWASARITLAESDFGAARVWPNPSRSARGDQSITFDQMPTGSTVKIFTVSARLVTTLQAPIGSISWPLTNDSGDKVASGLYLYLIIDGQGNKTRGKFTIIR
jgi:hypothetical protein